MATVLETDVIKQFKDTKGYFGMHQIFTVEGYIRRISIRLMIPDSMKDLILCFYSIPIRIINIIYGVRNKYFSYCPINDRWDDIKEKIGEQLHFEKSTISMCLLEDGTKRIIGDFNWKTEQLNERNVYFVRMQISVGEAIESLEVGTTLLKYGKYGKPKYKMFHLTADHKYLVWFSQKKSSENTRIRIKEIRKIAIGSESKVVEKTKKTDLHETSFTIYYGKTNNEKMWKALTVTAKNVKETFVWTRGLKILSDAFKKGKNIFSYNTDLIISNGLNGNAEIDKNECGLQSKLILFNESCPATATVITSLLKEHFKHKQQLQKCIDFAMTKSNYRAIANAGEWDKVKLKLEDLDNRLRDIKIELSRSDDMSNYHLSSVKVELFSCSADLDALKEKFTAIVRRPQKL